MSLSALEASQLISTGIAVELLALLGRWKSDAFAQYSKAVTVVEKQKDTASDDGLSEDSEEPAAVKNGSLWDLFRVKKVVELEVGKKDLVYSLTWSQPVTHSTPPQPRSGHSMTVVGKTIYIFGGTNGAQNFNSLHLFHIRTSTWAQKETTGQLPSPRQRHSATALPNENIVIFGGNGGDNEVYVLDTYSLSWTVMQSASEMKPTQRWGHSATLKGSTLFIIGGHTGYKSLEKEIWSLDINTWTWKLLESPEMSGVIPSAGSRHTATGLNRSDAIIVVGGSDTNTFKEVHELDSTYLRWYQRDTTGQTPPSRSRFCSMLVDQHIFVFGGIGAGRTLNDLFVFDTVLRRWNKPRIGGRAPASRMDHSGVVVQDEQGTRIFIFGGYDGHESLNDMHVLLTLTWGEYAPLGQSPPPRTGHTITVIGNKMILLGGDVKGRASADVFVFDLLEGVWSIPAVNGAAPQSLVSHSSCVVSAELFCFGGGDGMSAGNPLYVLSTDTFLWDMPATMGSGPVARYGHAAVVEGVNMYVFGGYEVMAGYSNKLNILDTSKLSWREPFINGMAPRPRACHSMTCVGKKIFIIGGSADTNVYGDFHVLDLINMTWNQPKTEGPTPFPRYLHCGVAIGSKIFIYGGFAPFGVQALVPKSRQLTWKRHKHGGFLVDDMFVLDVPTMTYEQPVIAGRGPGPRARHASAAWDSRVLIHGGCGGREEISTVDTGITLQSDIVTDAKEQSQLIISWLAGLGLQKYTKQFLLAEIDWDSLVHLDEADLQAIGIDALGPRKKILTAIANRKDDVLAKAQAGTDFYHGRYRLEGTVPFGASSTVKLATDMKTDQKVALKFISNEELYLHEVEMLKLLRSEYVVDLVEHYQDPEGKAHCIVLEHASRSLAQYKASHDIIGNERKSILERLARILEFLHTRSVVHGDFKLSNICLFGLKWKLIDLATTRKFQTVVSPYVTPFYCSPEVAKAIMNGQLSQLSALPAHDMWAFAMVFVEMFGLQLVKGNTATEVMYAIINFQEKNVQFESIGDPQAQHLARKLLKKLPLHRANIAAVLRHAFFAGGLDTEQKQAVFTFLEQAQTSFAEKVSKIRSLLITLQEKEEMMLEVEKKRIAAEEEAAKQQLAEI